MIPKIMGLLNFSYDLCTFFEIRVLIKAVYIVEKLILNTIHLMFGLL